MTQAPSISVVIPTYRRRDQCVAAVRSVLVQTASPLEVIVSDDGSADGTREAIEELASADARVRYLAAPSPSGRPAVARNRGIDAARGDWIGFLDDDDQWLPHKLEYQLPFLTGADAVVAGNAQRSSGAPYFSSPAPRRVFWADLVRDNPIIISSALARRDLLVSVGGFRTGKGLVGIEDYGLWLDLAQIGASFLLLPEIIVIYCDAGSRLSAMPLAQQKRVTAHFARRWAARRFDPRLSVGLATHAIRTLKLEGRRLRKRPVLR